MKRRDFKHSSSKMFGEGRVLLGYCLILLQALTELARRLCGAQPANDSFLVFRGLLFQDAVFGVAQKRSGPI